MKLNADQDDRVRVVTPAPLVYLASLIAGLVADLYYPIRLNFPITVTVGIGLAVIFGAAIIASLSLSTMRKVGASPDPSKPPKKLVVDGPFRFSRNPIYVSMTLGYVGIAVALNALLPLFFLIVALPIVDRFVISREEKYLERRFDEEYMRYKSRVRRWF